MQKEPRRSSYPAQTYTVREGDTLSGISSALWNDPAKWRVLADANEVANPRVLEPGRALIVPAIE
jgi:nucleoid-associated protein YgaU